MTHTDFTPLTSLVGGFLLGFAAILLMATTGRVAGISGFVPRLLPPYVDDLLSVRAAFIVGLLLAPLAVTQFSGRAIPHLLDANTTLLVVAGLLVGLGSVLGNGCTSGHGVCGVARFSRRSIAATATFMATAIIVVFLVRHVWGG